MSVISAISSTSANGGASLLSVSHEEAAAVERAREQASPPNSGFLSPFGWIEKLFGASFTADIAGLFQPLQQAGEEAGKRHSFLDMLGRVRGAEQQFGPASLVTVVEPLDPIADPEAQAGAETPRRGRMIDIRV